MATGNTDFHGMNWSEIKLEEANQFRPVEDAALARLPQFTTDAGDLALLIDALGLTDALQRRNNASTS